MTTYHQLDLFGRSAPILTGARPSRTNATTVQRDALWQALDSECGEAVTRSEQGRRARVVTELAEIGATPGDIHIRAVRYRAEWPSVNCSDISLVRHWSKFADNDSDTFKPITPLRPGNRILLELHRRRSNG